MSFHGQEEIPTRFPLCMNKINHISSAPEMERDFDGGSVSSRTLRPEPQDVVHMITVT